MKIRQVAYKTEDHHSNRCRATFSDYTAQGSALVAIGAINRQDYTPARVVKPSGFITVFVQTGEDVELHYWILADATARHTVEMYVDRHWSMQLLCYEITGAAQADAAFSFAHAWGDDTSPASTGKATAPTGESLAIAAAMNQHASVSQSGFTGGFSLISNIVTPNHGGDVERLRLTTHIRAATSPGSYALSAQLSSRVDWAAGIVVIKSGATGPVRLAVDATALTVTGEATLNVFGPLRADAVALTVSSDPVPIAPYDYQYRLGGWDGLLVGDWTPYRVEEIDGLEGWQLRTSDQDFPRDDGAMRGVDLQSARLIRVKLKVGGEQPEVEAQMDALYRALVPRRHEDWPLIWRHPGRPLRMLRCRPVDLLRGLSWRETLVNNQSFDLRAADPRHYAPWDRVVSVPVSTSSTSPTLVMAPNIGSGAAYPLIRVSNPLGSAPVERVELVNVVSGARFDVRVVLPGGSTLLGDMPARVTDTGVARSVITVDGQSKYGAWQFPRRPFALLPGINQVHLQTEPPGAPVACDLIYQDTWAG